MSRQRQRENTRPSHGSQNTVTWRCDKSPAKHPPPTPAIHLIERVLDDDGRTLRALLLLFGISGVLLLALAVISSSPILAGAGGAAIVLPTAAMKTIRFLQARRAHASEDQAGNSGVSAE
jgi:hypothetical protein